MNNIDIVKGTYYTGNYLPPQLNTPSIFKNKKILYF